MPGQCISQRAPIKYFLQFFLSLLFVLCPCLAVKAETGGNYGDTAPDFPQGEFSDGNHYHLSDFKGKIVVLFFYEQKCPTCRSTISHRNKIVRRYQKDPVMFIAIGAGDSLAEVKAYIQETHLSMPVFADQHSLMEKSYGFKISLGNIYQVRVISPDSIIVGYDMEPNTIDEALHMIGSKENVGNGPPAAPTDLQIETGSSTKNSALTGSDDSGTVSGSPAAKSASAYKHHESIRLNNEAVAAMDAGDNAAAIDKLKTVLKREPDYKIARENLKNALTNQAFALENKGKSAEAEKIMKQALDLAKELYTPDDRRCEEAVADYAGVLSRLGRSAEAQQMMDRLKTRD